MKTCENCGCKVYSGKCVNCHEAFYIQDQYLELGDEVPETILREVAEKNPEVMKNLEKERNDERRNRR